ncbi:MAG: hypothetical protein R2695_14330 [Acidimicrobiales bacterium]
MAALSKRVVHRQMEVMGLRTGIRQGTELCASACTPIRCASSSAASTRRASPPR